MKEAKVAVGAVVRESMGREEIVLSREEPPAPDWIDEQLDAEKIQISAPTSNGGE